MLLIKQEFNLRNDPDTFGMSQPELWLGEGLAKKRDSNPRKSLLEKLQKVHTRRYQSSLGTEQVIENKSFEEKIISDDKNHDFYETILKSFSVCRFLIKTLHFNENIKVFKRFIKLPKL